MTEDKIKRIRRSWTKEDEELFAKMATEGVKKSQIAKILNRKIAVLYCKAKLMNLETSWSRAKCKKQIEWTDKDTLKLIKLQNDKIDLKSVVKLMGFSESFIVKKIEELNIKSKLALQMAEAKERYKNNLRKCWRCQVEKTPDRFYPSRSLCIKCCLRENAEKNQKFHFNTDPKKILNLRLSTSKCRAKKCHREFDLDIDFLIDLYKEQEGKCFYSKHQMKVSPGSIYSLSIDRIDSNKGYTRDNIVLTCAVVNSMKTDLTIGEFIWFTHQISKNHTCPASI